MLSQTIKSRAALVIAAFFMFSIFAPFMQVNAGESGKIEAAYQKLKSLKKHYQTISMRQRELLTRGNPRDRRCTVAQKAMMRLKNEINRYTRIIQGLEEEAATQASPTPDDLINDTVDTPDQTDAGLTTDVDDFSIVDQANANAAKFADAGDDKTDSGKFDLSKIKITPPPAAPDFIQDLTDDDIINTDNTAVTKADTDNSSDNKADNTNAGTASTDTANTGNSTDNKGTKVSTDTIADSIDDIEDPDIDSSVTVSDVTSNPTEAGDFIMVVSPDQGLRLSADPNIAEAQAVIENGTILQILETQGDWVKVCYAPGKTGWVKKDALATQTDAGSVVEPPASDSTNGTTIKPDDTGAVVSDTSDKTDTASDKGSTSDYSDDTPNDVKVTDTNSGNSSTKPSSSFESYSDKEVVVKVPQRTQFDPVNGDYQNSWCGPTSLAMIFDYYGIHKTTAEVAKNTYNFEQRNGTPSNKLASEAKKYGFDKSRVETGKDLDFLENSCRAGKPVIVNVDVAWKSGHYMVVVGMTEDKIIVNDPGRRQIRREFDKEWFMTQWEGRSKRVIIIE